MTNYPSASKFSSNRMRTMCFSGSRPKSLPFHQSQHAYRPESWQSIFHTLVNYLSQKVSHGITYFVTGGAQGWDMFCFKAVQELKHRYPQIPIRNVVFIPFCGQELRWAKYGLFSQTEYRQMLADADEIYVVSDIPADAAFQDICIALDTRNHAMIDVSQSCLFLEPVDNSLENMKGGTANCFRYAKNQIQSERFRYRINAFDIIEPVEII